MFHYGQSYKTEKINIYISLEGINYQPLDFKPYGAK